MKLVKHAIIAFALTASAGMAQAQQAPTAKADPAVVDKIVEGMWGKAAPEWRARVVQDETQRICTQTDNAPPQAEFEKIMARELATVVYPADGVMGDWKAGEQVAQRGTGGQFTDRPDTYQGGNCYACHQLRKDELSYGTLGPSLMNYGRDRKFEPEAAKAAYAKVFNAQAVMPCSQMPRFGYHKFLTEKQMKDVVAYIFSPDSPVNK